MYNTEQHIQLQYPHTVLWNGLHDGLQDIMGMPK